MLELPESMTANVRMRTYVFICLYVEEVLFLLAEKVLRTTPPIATAHDAVHACCIAFNVAKLRSTGRFVPVIRHGYLAQYARFLR